MIVLENIRLLVGDIAHFQQETGFIIGGQTQHQAIFFVTDNNVTGNIGLAGQADITLNQIAAVVGADGGIRLAQRGVGRNQQAIKRSRQHG